MITPEVGQQYRLGDEVVEVVEALKRRYWRIRVAPAENPEWPNIRTIPESEWAAKAERVGS